MANTPVFRTSYTCKKDGKCPFCNPRLAALMRADAAGDSVTVSRMLDEDTAAVIRAKQEASMSQTITKPKAATQSKANTKPKAATTSNTSAVDAALRASRGGQGVPPPPDLRDLLLLSCDLEARTDRAERAVYENEMTRLRSAQNGEAAPPAIDLNARIRLTRGAR